jgi:transcriptional regulator with XRE-family HTH domain
MDAARRLAVKFGSDTIALPLARSWRIHVYRARGWSYPQIAKAVGVSEATVARLLKDMGLTNQRNHEPDASASAADATPAPLVSVRMPLIRRTAHPDLPLFQGIEAATAASGADRGRGQHG